MAFALGRLVDRRDQIIVVTNSFALEQSMLAAVVEYKQAEIVLAFFGRQLDQRWLSVVQGGNSWIKFWDLDENSEAIFGQSALVRNSTMLAHLK